MEQNYWSVNNMGVVNDGMGVVNNNMGVVIGDER